MRAVKLPCISLQTLGAEQIPLVHSLISAHNCPLACLKTTCPIIDLLQHDIVATAIVRISTATVELPTGSWTLSAIIVTLLHQQSTAPLVRLFIKLISSPSTSMAEMYS